jgi:hypothetical protein
MRSQQFVKVAAGGLAILTAIVLSGTSSSSSRLLPEDVRDNKEASLIKLGFEIAPVPLNLTGKDRDLVGLGSYMVNAVGDCNGCHTGGGPPNFNYTATGNPYFGQRAVVDPTVYLSGGTDFGPALPPGFYDPGFGGYLGPDIISRNLTPDKTGRAEGGHTLSEFKQIIRTGIDLDHLHPTCTDISPTPTPANCLPPPNDGSVLQVMPWPTFQYMTDHQLDAIYEYLSSIPCLEGSPDPASNLHNDCGPEPAVGKAHTASVARRAKP